MHVPGPSETSKRPVRARQAFERAPVRPGVVSAGCASAYPYVWNFARPLQPECCQEQYARILFLEAFCGQTPGRLMFLQVSPDISNLGRTPAPGEHGWIGWK